MTGLPEKFHLTLIFKIPVVLYVKYAHDSKPDLATK